MLCNRTCMMKIENNATPPAPTLQPSLPAIDARLRDVLAGFPTLVLALLFGSVAQGRQRADSDLDIAVAAKQALTSTEKMTLIEALAECTGRPIDLCC